MTGLYCGTSYEISLGALGDGSTYAPRWSEFSNRFATTDDCEVSFGASSYEVVEGRSQTITVEMSTAPGRDITIPIVVTPGTDRSVTINANNTSGTVSIPTSHDTDADDETVDLEFGSLPSGVDEGTPSSATLTILDDDRTVRLQLVVVHGG